MTAAASTRSDRWLAPAGFAAATALVLLPALLGPDPLYGFDTVQEKFFWRSWAYGRVARGDWPWWCAGLVGGFPLISEPIAQFWYPPVAALHLVFPIARAINLTWWLHLTWAALGMFRLLRTRGLEAPPSSLGGLAYALSGWMVGHVPMGGLPHLAACAWAPWLVAALLGLLEARRAPEPRQVGLAALTVAASILAGHAQFTYGTLLFLALFAALAFPGRMPGGGVTRARGAGLLWARLVSCGLAVGLGLALAAAMLVPYAELLAASNRGASLPGEFADFGARLPPVQLLASFAPGFFGGDGGVPYWGFPTREAVTPYLGVVPLALVLSPVPRRARREAWALRAIAVLGLLLAMGPATPVLAAVRAVAPLMDRARHPARWLLLAMLAGSWLAGWGAQQLMDRARPDPAGLGARIRRIPGGAGLAVVASLALATWAAFAVGDGGARRHATLIAAQLDDSTLDEDDGLRAGQNDALARARSRSASACTRALAYCVTALGLVSAARCAGQPRSAGWALVGLTALDLVSQGRRDIEPLDRSVLPWPSAIARAAADAAPDGRITTTVPGADFPFPAAFRGSHAALSRIGQVDMHRPLLVGAATPQGGIPTTPSRWLRLALGEGAYDFNYAPVGPRTVLDRLSVGLVLTAPGVRPVGTGWDRVLVDDHRWLWRNGAAIRRASLVHRCVALSGDADVLRVLRETGRELPPAVVLAAGSCPDGIDPLVPAPGPPETVRWLHNADERVTLQTSTRSGALLRLSDAAMPGWLATVDGRPVPVTTVDFALRGVVVPAGTHQVEFRYGATAARVGIGITVAALAVVVVLLTLPTRQAPRSPAATPGASVTGESPR